MTQEMRELLDEEINTALEAKDNERLLRVMARYHKATGDCQAKTSDRVKHLVEVSNATASDVKNLTSAVTTMQTLANSYRDERERKKGALIIARILWAVASGLLAVLTFIWGKSF